MNGKGDLWDKLVLRLQSLSYRRLRGQGIAIVTVRLLLRDGILLSWAEPSAVTFEPAGQDAEGRILAVLTGEAMEGAVDEAEPEIEVVAPAK